MSNCTKVDAFQESVVLPRQLPCPSKVYPHVYSLMGLVEKLSLMSSDEANEEKTCRDFLQCWDGALSASEFRVAASTFSHKWRTFNSSLPPWSWVPSQKTSSVVASQTGVVDGYLSLENICLDGAREVGHHNSNSKSEEGNSFSEHPEPSDDATLIQSSCHEVHLYDFHIVYSDSYRVPVLYFRAYRSDGQPLMLSEIEKDVPCSTAKGLLESKWTFITQEEHPYLNRPWYKLHPCGTSEWMKLLFLSGRSSLNHLKTRLKIRLAILIHGGDMQSLLNRTSAHHLPSAPYFIPSLISHSTIYSLQYIERLHRISFEDKSMSDERGNGDESKDRGLMSNMMGYASHSHHHGSYPAQGYPPQGYPPSGGYPPGAAGGYPPPDGGYPPMGGGGYPPAGYTAQPGYPPAGAPPAGYPPSSYPNAPSHHHSGHGGMGAMVAGGAAAAAAGYGAHHLAHAGQHGGHHGGHHGSYGHHGYGHGKFKHGKHKHGKHKHGKYKKWK